MPEFATPRKPYGPIKDEFSPKQSIMPQGQPQGQGQGPAQIGGSYDPMQQEMQMPLRVPDETYNYQPTLDDIKLFNRVGASPIALFGEDAVMRALPVRQNYDPNQPGYKNNESTVYDINGEVVYDGDDDVSPFIFNEFAKKIVRNPQMDAVEHDKNFFQDQSGTWHSARTQQAILDFRPKTTWENIWQGTLDPMARVGHWMENINTVFWERLLDQRHNKTQVSIQELGEEIFTFENTVGNYVDALWESGKEVFSIEGLTHGWKTDLAPTQPGYVKALMGLGGANEAFYRDINTLARKETKHTDKVFKEAFKQSGNIWRGALTKEGLFGTQVLDQLVKVGGISVLDGKVKTDLGKSLENYLSISTVILMSMGDPLGAADLALTGGLSTLRRARHLNKFGLLGNARKAIDEYRAILKADGPDVLMEVMRRNNPDVMTRNHWADLYAEVSRAKIPALHIGERISRRFAKYGMGKHKIDPEKLKQFIGLDTELALERLGQDGLNRLLSIMGEAVKVNGHMIWHAGDFLEESKTLFSKNIIDEILESTSDVKPLFDGVELKSLHSGNLTSLSEEASFFRKAHEGGQQTAHSLDNYFDTMSEAHLFDEMDRGRLAVKANTQRAKRGFGSERFPMKNPHAEEMVEDAAMAQMAGKAANDLAQSRILDDVVETPAQFTKQLTDPAVKSTTGKVIFRKTDWVKFRRSLKRVTGDDPTAWDAMKKFVLGDKYQYATGGRIGGLTDDAVQVIRDDMQTLNKLTKNLDIYANNIKEIETILKKYPRLKMPGQFRSMVKVKPMHLSFGPKATQGFKGNRLEGEIWGGMEGLQEIKKLDANVNMVDDAGQMDIGAVDRMNLWAAQAMIWDGNILDPGVSQTARNIKQLENGVVPGGSYKNMGEAVQGLIEKVGLQDSYKAMKVDNEWTVVDPVTFNATDRSIDIANRAADLDIFQEKALARAIENPNITKPQIAEEMTSPSAKRSLNDIDAEVNMNLNALQQQALARANWARNAEESAKTGKRVVLRKELAGKPAITGKPRTYDEAQNLIDEFENQLIKKYGSEDVLSSDIKTGEILTGATKKENEKFNRLLNQRDAIEKVDDTQIVSRALDEIDEGPLNTPELKSVLEKMQEKINLGRATGNITAEGTKDKLISLYMDALKKAEWKPEVMEAWIRQDIPIEELISGKKAMTGFAPVAKQLKQVVDAITGQAVRPLAGPTPFETGQALGPKARALWQQERGPGTVSLGNISSERLMEHMQEDLISSWESIKTPEVDEILIDQIQKRLGEQYQLQRGDDFIAIIDKARPGTALYRSTSTNLQGRAIMQAIQKGPKMELFSLPLPKLDIVSDQVQIAAEVVTSAAKEMASNIGPLTKASANGLYKKLRAVYSNVKARAWLDARELFGDMAYREQLRMNEEVIRQKMNDEVLETIMLDLIDDIEVSKNWKNVYQSKLTPKFAKNLMLHRTKVGKQLNEMLAQMQQSAEGIKYMPANGDEAEIIFGTKSFKTFMERVPTDTHVDGKANPGLKRTGKYIRDPKDEGKWNKVLIDEVQHDLTPEKSKELWDRLTDKQKHYLIEYTREGGTQHVMFENFRTFNREVAADFYNITSKREGFMHHTFNWNEGQMKGVDELPSEHAFGPLQRKRKEDLRAAKSDPRKYRKGDMRYQQNFIDSISEYTRKLDKEQIRNKAFSGVERNVLVAADDMEALKMADPTKHDRMIRYVPQFEENRIAGQEFFVDKIIAEQLAATSGTSEVLSKMNDWVNIGKKNLLAHSATWSTNLVSAVLQQSTYFMENTFRAMLGDATAWRRVTNTHKAFLAAFTKTIPNEIFGAHHTRAFQFGKQGGLMNEMSDFLLTPMGAIENFFKRWTFQQELLTKNKTMDDILTSSGEIKDMDTMMDISKVVDLYNLDYSNVSLLTDWMRKNPLGGMIMPFATFPYKMSKSMAYYGDALNPITWVKHFGRRQELGPDFAQATRELTARFMTASAMIGGGVAYGMLSEKEEAMPDWMEGMDYQVNNTGRINYGFMDDDSYVRFGKYPGLNVFSAAAKMGRRLESGQTLWETTSNTFHEVTDTFGEMFTIGGDINMIMSAAGFSDKFSRNKSFWQQASGQAYHHIPGLGVTKRWGEDINRVIQQEQGGQSRSIRNMNQQLMSQIPFTAYSHPGMQGDITRFSSPIDNQYLRAFFGVNIRKIDKRKALSERKKAEKAEVRKAESEKTQELSNITGKYIDPRFKGKRKRRRRKQKKR